MATMVGKQLDVILSYGDGREYRLDGALVQSLEISQGIEDASMFSMDLTAPTTRVSISGYASGNSFQDLFLLWYMFPTYLSNNSITASQRNERPCLYNMLHKQS